MKYIDFQNKFKNYPIIHLSDIKNIESNFDNRRLYEWQKKGYLKKVANNFYIFADKNFSESEINFIANQLYDPSYISLEYALAYYGLIPEIVYLKTCVSTKKTKRINSIIGNFSYQKIKKELFFGYHFIKNGDTSFKIAEIEKALLDFFYLRKDIVRENDLYEMRFNIELLKEKINQDKLQKYLKIFNSKKMNKKIKIFNKILNYA